MKKFLITYIIISIVLFFAVYIGTLFTAESSRRTVYYAELTEEVVESKNIEKLVEYQVSTYQKIDSKEEHDYYYEIYQVTFDYASDYFNQIVIYIIPSNLKLADKYDDENDQMDIKYESTSGVDSFKVSYNKPISYLAYTSGIIYYAKTFTNDMDLTLTFLDYDGNALLEKELKLTYYNKQMVENSSFINGMTPNERYEAEGIRAFQETHLLITIPLFLVFDIGIGVFLYFNKKRKVVRYENI